jgi:DNA-binding NarL/FixJ family response regulator
MIPTILLADDHIMISRALRKLFEIDFGYRDTESVTSCAAVLKMLKKRQFTHLVIDIGLSDGSALEILPVIKDVYPGLKIMVYSAKPSGVYGRGLQKFGVDYYLSKDASELESIRQFRIFLGGLETCRPKPAPTVSPFSTLTDRQLQVMHYLLNGKSGVEIAEALNVKTSTVSTLKSQLLERTGAKNMMELTALASLYSMA